MYAFGQGVEKNEAEAFNWFKQSASRGVAQAQFNLGVFYENGTTVNKNIDLAKSWYRKAADQGLLEAKQRLEFLEGQQTTADSTPGTNAAGNENIIHPTGATENDTAFDATGIKREEWVLKQNPSAYTLQLSSVLHEKDIVKFIREHKLGSDAAYVKVIVNGVTRYSALYGVYNTYDQARNSIKDLPGDLNKAKPWVRNFGIIQGLLAKPSG